MPAATSASSPTFQSRVDRSKAYQRSGPARISTTDANSTCSANQTVRLRITPTTAAVTAASAPDSRWLARSCSTNGAPAKISSIGGTKVTQVVSAEPSTALVTGENGSGLRQAPRKPTNCVTLISGPGSVSAKPSPSTISGAVIQPWVSTACCAM